MKKKGSSARGRKTAVWGAAESSRRVARIRRRIVATDVYRRLLADNATHNARVERSVVKSKDYVAFCEANGLIPCAAALKLFRLLAAIDVNFLNLSSRGLRRLPRLKIGNLAKLCSCPPEILLQGRNFGVDSLKEIREKLWLLGVELPQDEVVPPWRRRKS